MMIRWKGVLLLAVLSGIFIVLSLIFTDRWLESQLEKAGSRLVGAKVEIDGLDFSFSKARLEWKRLQVTDPKHTMRNLFETGTCDLNFEFWPLLSRKIIVENFEISGFKPNTPRRTDGKLPQKAAKKSGHPDFFKKVGAKLTQNISRSTNLPLNHLNQKVNTDSILKILNVQAPHKIDSLKQAIEQRYAFWQKRLKKLHLDDDLLKVKQQIQTIHPEKIKTLAQLQKTLRTLQSVQKKIKRLSDSLKITHADLQAELKHLQQSVQLINQWVQEDYLRALKLARIPSFTKENMARMIFGPTLVKRFTNVLTYVHLVRYYAAKFKSTQPKKEHPPRFKGQDIYFYSPNARPDWWIKRIKLAGQTANGLQLVGQIRDLVSDQRFIQKPTIIRISGSAKDGRSFELQGKLNYLQEIPREVFKLSYLHFPLKNVRLSESPYLPQKLAQGIGSLKADLTLQGNALHSSIHFVVTRLAFASSNTTRALNNPVQRLIGDVLRKIHTLTLNATIESTAERLHFTLNSNLDDLLVREFKSRLNAQITQARKRIRAEIEKRTAQARRNYERFVAQKEQTLQDQLKRYQQLLDQQKALLKKRQKAIEKRIAKEKNNKAKEVQKKLKSLFK